MDFNLSRIKAVAKRINIHKTTSKVFTVAGTNGKGSTVAILESILVESGYKVGSYTSPHLINFNERIKINKIPSSTKEICEAFEVIEKHREDITLTYFEFSTLAAFIIFKQKKLDIIILEVGLGGRLDAVNIINPDVSIITNIGLDHTAILGNDVEKIAYEKSGIMRTNKPTIIGYNNIHNSILKKARDIKSNLNIINKEYFYKKISDKSWYFSNHDGLEIECDNPGIKGEIQISNAAAAVQAIHCCDCVELNQKYINVGLKNASIIGRFQVLDKKPETILDIAHNEQSVEKLIENLRSYYPSRKLHAVFGVLKDKNLDLILKPLKNIFESWHISNSNNERALSAHELKKNNFFILEKPNVYDTIEDAYNGAIEIADINKDVIIVFGSSYTIAPILKRREI